MLTVGVCDANGRLLGAVTVDDVLDNALPADWRRKILPRDQTNHEITENINNGFVRDLNGGRTEAP